ncbi:MAG: RHS repeat-associated core domain-containing protein [Candidatus Zixiibacteriota bacterium]|nr:MAG: RHS repeat-associated core domain-containing protein [candidate division Zixibacteria bacterium]
MKKLTYDSFGNIVADSGSVIADDVTYTGREHESALGIYFYRARYYDPLTGRFITLDPIDYFAGDVNLYRYVFNNPIQFKDGLGLRIDWIDPLSNPPKDFVFANQVVVENLIALNQAIIDQGYPDDSFTIRITGGDRYLDADNIIRSVTNNYPINNSESESMHLREFGAGAADFALEGICEADKMEVFLKAFKATEFDAFEGPYDDKARHLHVQLPKTPYHVYAYPFNTWNHDIMRNFVSTPIISTR